MNHFEDVPMLIDIVVTALPKHNENAKVPLTFFADPGQPCGYVVLSHRLRKHLKRRPLKRCVTPVSPFSGNLDWGETLKMSSKRIPRSDGT
jgi:hypothetical protein